MPREREGQREGVGERERAGELACGAEFLSVVVVVVFAVCHLRCSINCRNQFKQCNFASLWHCCCIAAVVPPPLCLLFCYFFFSLIDSLESNVRLDWRIGTVFSSLPGCVAHQISFSPRASCCLR